MVIIRAVFSPYELADLAAVQISKCLYAQRDVKNFIKVSSENSDSSRREIGSQYIYYANLYNVPDNALQARICKMPLSKLSKERLVEMVKAMGLQLCDWITMVKRYIDAKTKIEHYINHIDFTYDGRVNEIVVIRSMYNANIFPKNLNTFAVLSHFCMKDLLEENWPTLQGENICSNCQSTCSPKTSHRGDDSSTDQPDNIVKLFLNSIENGNSTACRLLWPQLNDSKRKIAIATMWETIFHPSNIKMTANEKPVDALIFLWQQLSDENSAELFKFMLSVRWIFHRLCHWPWEKMFVTTIKRSWRLLEHQDCQHILNNTSYILFWDKCEYEYYFKWWPVFETFWAKVSMDWTKSLDLDCIIDSLMQHYESLEFIVDDSYLAERRIELLSYVVRTFRNYSYDERVLEAKKLITFFHVTGHDKKKLMKLAKGKK